MITQTNNNITSLHGIIPKELSCHRGAGFFIGDYRMEIPAGYCQCGCGQITNISKINRVSKGQIKGRHFKFIHNHQPTGDKASAWKGGFKYKKSGYKLIRISGHHRMDVSGYVLEHIVIAEKALGKHLPKDAQIHHYGSTRDNTKIVICENQKYHWLLETRQRAYRNCGNPNWKKCKYCKQYDNPKNLTIACSGVAYHKKCKREYARLSMLQKLVNQGEIK